MLGGPSTLVQHALITAATDNFSAACRIGGGGSCEVYKAVVYGVTVAVKALHQHNVEDDGGGQNAQSKQRSLMLEAKQFAVGRLNNIAYHQYTRVM